MRLIPEKKANQFEETNSYKKIRFKSSSKKNSPKHMFEIEFNTIQKIPISPLRIYCGLF